MPLSRHNERPALKGTIVDITCDSDGSLENFVDQVDRKKALDLHTPNGEPYYLGFFLVGAYQEALSNEHNLFGATFESEVFIGNSGEWKICKITSGDPVDELLTCRNYNIDQIISSYERQLERSKNVEIISEDEKMTNFENLKNLLGEYPYLKSK